LTWHIMLSTFLYWYMIILV